MKSLKALRERVQGAGEPPKPDATYGTLESDGRPGERGGKGGRDAEFNIRCAEWCKKRGQDLADNRKIKSLWYDLFRGVRRFFKCYVSRKGYREGDMGFLIAIMAGLYPLLSNLKAREILYLAQREPHADLGGAVVDMGLEMGEVRLGHSG